MPKVATNPPPKSSKLKPSRQSITSQTVTAVSAALKHAIASRTAESGQDNFKLVKLQQIIGQRETAFGRGHRRKLGILISR